MKENEVGTACGMHRRVEKRVQGSGGKAQRERIACKTKARLGGWDQNAS
jgi:hypothetical protein